MKILLTGGGTGGHFYPLIAVAEEIREVAKEKKLLNPEIYYMATNPYSESTLFDHDIIFRQITAGKLRREPGIVSKIKNFFGLFSTALGIVGATLQLFSIYPDVVFGKGGYVSFPVLWAARLLHIPVVIHESDSKPGRVNAWAGKFAVKIAVSYPEAAEYFPKAKDGSSKVAYTGNPVRKDIAMPITNGAREYLHLEEGAPVIFIMGGSQGAVAINDAILNALPELVKNYQIIHQTGRQNQALVQSEAKVILEKSEHKERYKPFDYLNALAMRMVAGAANIVVSRSGSSIFEIAAWGLPSIIIPIPERVSHDQRKNAFAYARSGAAIVIEQDNLTPEILLSELKRVLSTPTLYAKMQQGAKDFAKLDAAHKIAEALVDIALKHEK
jgi:UDP-N-acetylglucosamine--N-acetylmuramyl-(pentapeptide) pyrophosphoryl-undecaprenol N-acetylglucosamine transferase